MQFSYFKKAFKLFKFILTAVSFLVLKATIY